MHPPVAQIAFPKRQRGLSFFGFLFTAAVLVFVALLAMKVVPAYIEYFSVKKVLAAMAMDSRFDEMSASEIRGDFERRISADYIRGVSARDLAIERIGGKNVVRVEYEVRTPLFGHASLVLDFKASTAAEP